MSKPVTYTREYIDKYKSKAIPTGSKFINLIGRVYDNLIIIKFKERKIPYNYWFAECKSCGSYISISSGVLKKKPDSKCTSCNRKDFGTKCSLGWEKTSKPVLDKFPNISLLDYKDEKSKTKWVWLCKICDTRFESSPNSFSNKQKTSCKCNPHLSGWTKEDREHQIQTLCEGRNLKFLGWCEEFSPSNKTRILLSCGNKKHKPYESSVNNFTSKVGNYGCPLCGILKRALSNSYTQEEFNARAKRVHGGLYDYSSYKYINSRVTGEIKCNSCLRVFRMTGDNHINKKEGCTCKSSYGYKTNKPGYFYIQSLDSTYLKFGITNKKPIDRLNRIQKRSDFNHLLIEEFYFEDGSIPLKIENICKKTLSVNVVSKSMLVEGFTETCKFSELSNILEIVDGEV